MERFSVTPAFDGDCVASDGSRVGEVYHVVRNAAGGANMTPVGRYFCWRPSFVENFHSHWRIDCFVSRDDLVRDPMKLGEALVGALCRQNLLAEPIWLSVHCSNELEGKAFGEVFDFD